MILRRFCLIKCWAALFVLGFSFASCNHTESAFYFHDDLMRLLMEISECITGKQKVEDDNNDIIWEQSCEKNFPKADKLFADVEKMLRAYPKITGYPIAQSMLSEISESLSKLKQDIEGLPDGRDKVHFRSEWNQLAQYVSPLMAEKDMSQRSTAHSSSRLNG